MTVIYALDLIGTVAFAASGAFAGVRRNLDLLGVQVLGVVTAIGGGTLRDMLLGDLPPFCLKDEAYLYLSIAVSLLIFFQHRRLRILHYPLRYFDAVGLGTFVVIGTQKALSADLGALSAILLGTMTATAGGVLRDILSNQIPLILRREFYATSCLLGGLILVILHHLAVWPTLSALLAACTVIGLRLMAIRNRWALPRPRRTR